MRWAIMVLTWNAERGFHRFEVARFRHWGQAKAFFVEMERQQYPALLEMRYSGTEKASECHDTVQHCTDPVRLAG
jgi:hypothetical protein